MPEAKVYLCDKTEGLEGEHRKCGREVGPDGVMVVLTLTPVQERLDQEKSGVVADLRFCGWRHAQYWLIRQRVAREGG